MKKIIMLAALLLASATCHAEEIIVDLAVGCPTIESYTKYAEITRSGNGAATLQAAANLDCRMMFKGDKVKVLEWKALKNLVRVHPEGNSMTFWLPGEFVTTK